MGPSLVEGKSNKEYRLGPILRAHGLDLDRSRALQVRRAERQQGCGEARRE